MIKLLTFFILISSILYAKEIKPVAKFHSIGFVSDFVIHLDKLYVANDAGTVEIFNMKTQKILDIITLPPLISSLNKIIPADVLSVDYFNGKVLILSVGKNAYRNVWIYENNTLKKIIDESKKLTIKEARFIDDEKIMFSTLGADIILHDISEQYSVYNTHISDSAMQDIELSQDKTKMLISDESGEIKLVDVKSSKIISTYKPLNLDNVYKVVSANGITLTAGQDRRVGIYRTNQKNYYIETGFLVFCVGISPSGKLGLYSSGDESNMQLFNTNTKEKLHLLLGHTSVINKITFINEQEIISSDRGHDILYWNIP